MSEPVQLTSVVRKLGDLAGLVNPARLITVIGDVVREIKTPPPGNADALDALAAAHRVAAASFTPIAREIAALDGSAVVRATASRVEWIPEAFTATADTLAEWAAAVRDHQRRHAELHAALEAAAYDATHIGSVPLPDPVGIARLVGVVGDLITGCVAVYTDSLAATDRASSRFTDLRGAARAAAGVAAGLTPEDAVVIAGKKVGALAAHYEDGLGLTQLARLGALSGLDRAVLDVLLAAVGSDAERAWLLRAAAAGHGPTELGGFARAIRGQDEQWLNTHLSLVDRGGESAQVRMGVAVRQYEATTCGTTTLIVARAEHDPLYALSLTSGDFQSAFTAERGAVHDETNVIYPQAAGTSPKGVAAYLTRHIGVPYEWRLVDDTDKRAISSTLRDVVAAVDRGVPVPILVGGIVPRHYVLALGHERGTLLVFEPTAGVTVAVPEADFLAGNLRAALGFDHVQSVVLPGQAGQPLSAGRSDDGSK
ncbi:hypothetical protein [Actinokineospora sp. HUAS TT18]|uniref:hypothetical protein n=1 Tax=Actinokineospora sp. HUAS TT18 TaxID=3447451 RepID=UPI003F51CCCB